MQMVYNLIANKRLQQKPNENFNKPKARSISRQTSTTE